MRDVQGAGERQLLDQGRVRRVLGTALRTALEALLERVDPVEPRAVRPLVRGVAAGRVAELEHAGETLVEIAGVELEQLAVAAVDVLHPRAGEAVGLLLGQDRGGKLRPRLRLDHMTPLVRQHLRECERAELLVQAREEVMSSGQWNALCLKSLYVAPPRAQSVIDDMSVFAVYAWM